MAERDKILRAFRGHDAGDTGRREHVALRRGAAFEKPQCWAAITTKPSATAVLSVNALPAMSTMAASPFY